MKKGVVFSLFIIVAFIFSLSLASAGFSDFLGNLFGDSDLSPPTCTEEDNGEEIKTLSVGQTAEISGLSITLDSLDYQVSIRLLNVHNVSSGYLDDDVIFMDSDGNSYSTSIFSEGIGSVNIKGKSYTVEYFDNPGVADDEYVIIKNENNQDTVSEGEYISFFYDRIDIEFSSEFVSAEITYIPSNANNPPMAYSPADTGKDGDLSYLVSLSSASKISADIKVQTSCDACIENWFCGDWLTCHDGQQTRGCTDINYCGTDYDKPEEVRSCGSECVEDWACSEWSECVSGTQTRTCQDSNNCGTFENKPSLSQNCNIDSCTENWGCTNWGTCTNNQQSRVCTDSNSCGTFENKPEVTKNCNSCVYIEVANIHNVSSGFSDDMVKFKDGNGKFYDTSIFFEGEGSVAINGNTYPVEYFDNPGVADDEYVIINGKKLYEDGLSLRLVILANKSSGFSDDIVKFEDNSGKFYEASIFSEGIGSLNVQGKNYNIAYFDDISIADDEYVTIDGKEVKEKDTVILEDLKDILKLGCDENSDNQIVIEDDIGNAKYIRTFPDSTKIYIVDYENDDSSDPNVIQVWLGRRDSSIRWCNSIGTDPSSIDDEYKINREKIEINGNLIYKSSVSNTAYSWRTNDNTICGISITNDNFNTITSAYLEKYPSNLEFEQVIDPKDKPISLPGEEADIIKGAIVCQGCVTDGKCYPIGYRDSGEYCSGDYEFINQLEEDSMCQNNFECDSNVCVSGECISINLIRKVINWFKNLFGN